MVLTLTQTVLPWISRKGITTMFPYVASKFCKITCTCDM